MYSNWSKLVIIFHRSRLDLRKIVHSFRNEFFTCLFKVQNVQVIQNDVIKCCKMISSNVALLHSNNCCVLEPAICEDLDLHVVFISVQLVFLTFNLGHQQLSPTQGVVGEEGSRSTYFLHQGNTTIKPGGFGQKRETRSVKRCDYPTEYWFHGTF